MKNLKDENLKNEFSEADGNMEIIQSEAKLPAADNDNIDIDVADGGRILINKLNVIIQPLKDRHERHYKGSKFHLIADIILAGIILVLVSALIWIKTSNPSKNIYLESKSPSGKIISGNLETIEISYGNRNGEEVEDCNITFVVPKNFIFEKAEPDNIFEPETRTFRLGNIQSGANGTIKISGIPMGEMGERQNISFIFNFKKNGSPLRVLNSFNYTIGGSALETALNIPEKIYQGVDFKGSLIAKNSGNRDLDAVEIILGGNDLKIRQSDSVFSDKTIVIERLKAGQTENIHFTAVTQAKEGKNHFDLTGSVVSGKEKIKQVDIRKEAVVSVPKLKISVESPKGYLSPGEDVPFVFAYENISQTILKNVAVSFSSDNENFSLSSLVLSDASGMAKKDNSVVISQVQPKATGRIDMTAKFSRKKVVLNDTVGLVISVVYDDGGENVSYSTVSPANKVSSDMKVNSVVYYYSPQGDQLGVGPLPPTVGIPTRYWIFLNIDNEGNDLKNFNLSAELPENVFWTNRKSLLSGNIQYGQVGKRVIWSVDDMSKEKGSYRAEFEVEVLPAKKDIGKILDLLRDIKYSVTDSFTGKQIGGQIKDMNTDLQADKLSVGKGRVTE